MLKPNLLKWKITDELNGLLLFAQLIEEMLFNYTIDSYKVPALNTKSRCFEILSAISDIKEERLQKGTLKPMLEELAWSLENDIVSQKMLGSNFQNHVIYLKSGKTNIYSLETRINYILKLLGDRYLDQIKEEIKEILQKPTKKKQIEILTRLFVTELINEGFSESEIYHESKCFFFNSSKIVSIDIINDYFKKFSPKNKKWEVIIKGETEFNLIKDFAKCNNIKISPKTPKLKKNIKKEKDFLNKTENEVYIIFNEIEAYDVHSAKIQANKILRTLSSLIEYHKHKSKLSWDEKAIVYNKLNNHFSIVGSSVKAVYKRPDKKDGQIPDLIKDTVGIFSQSALNEKSRHKLLRSIGLHSDAISANNEENQLLTFWASLESLIPSSRDRGKIEHFIEYLEPFLVSGYCKKHIYYLNKNLIVYDGMNKIISTVEEGESNFDKLAAIITLKEKYEYKRDEIYSLIGNNVLLRNRVYSLMTKFCSSDSILKTIEEHKLRVIWHLQRIYRMRNLIIHSGSTLPYLGILVENLHAYTDQILDLIGETIIYHGHLSSLDEIMLEVSLNNQSHIDLLKKSKQQNCKEENYKLFLYGYPN